MARDVAIFALGNMVAEAEKLAKMLKAEGQSVAVINARFAKPVDAECIAKYGAALRADGHDGRPCARGRIWVGGAGDA